MATSVLESPDLRTLMIRLAEVNEALLTRSAVDVMLARGCDPDEAVDAVMQINDLIVNRKRRGRS